MQGVAYQEAGELGPETEANAANGVSPVTRPVTQSIN